jgi:hypothetical protein
LTDPLNVLVKVFDTNMMMTDLAVLAGGRAISAGNLRNREACLEKKT